MNGQNAPKITHSPPPWTFREQGDANHYCLLTEDGRWVLGVLHNGEHLPAVQLENMRLIVRAVNNFQTMRDLLEAVAEDGADGSLRAEIRLLLETLDEEEEEEA